MNIPDFDIDKIKDPRNKLVKLADYGIIKKAFFQYADDIVSGDMSAAAFHDRFVAPYLPRESNIEYTDTLKFVKLLKPEAMRLVTIIQERSKPAITKTLLEKEREKLVQQLEIRQDVTGLMHGFIQHMKSFVSDSEKMGKLTAEEIQDLYKMIREEEDRAKTLTLKERAEDRADAQFAFIVAEAKAGQLSAEDIAMLEDDIKHDLLVFKQSNGVYQLPTNTVPAFVAATENPAGQPGQAD